MIKLGQRVIDEVSGYEGIATGKCEYLNGCVQFAVQARKTQKEGKLPKVEWIDEGQLKVVGEPKKKSKKKDKLPQGGMREHPF